MPWLVVGPYDEGRVFVDDEDVAFVQQYTWYQRKDGYVLRREQKDGEVQYFYLHRELMKPDDGQVVDHIDLDPRMCSRSNMRLCSFAENRMNSIVYEGHGTTRHGDRWKAQIKHQGVKHHIGVFDTQEEAHEAYKRKAIELRGEFVNRLLKE